MLKSLHIENYVLIDSLDVSFPESLAIITGQTGAGKSILLGALSLLMGAKTDAGVISRGASSCIVEGVFSTDNQELKAFFEENDIDWTPEEIVVRRVVGSTGRSRAFIGDCPVPLQLLSDISASLLDIHSQHQSLRLSDRKFQTSVLDRYAGAEGKAGEVSAAWRELTDARAECRRLEDLSRSSALDDDYRAARLAQLEEARLREGEMEELEEEHDKLANAEQIKESLSRVSCLFSPEDGDGVDSSLKEMSRLMSATAALVPSLSSLAGRLDSVRIELADIASEVSDTADSVDMSGGRLETVEARMSLLFDLCRRHGCTSVSELIAVRDRYAAELSETSSLEEKLEAAKAAEEAAENKFKTLCAELSVMRMDAAPRFAGEITEGLHYLELENSLFAVDVESCEPGPSGVDFPVFRFTASGSAPVDVSKCASGGELSRIMLCIKSLMAKHASMPTLVFDEIDTGVSGSVADKMGSMICSMGASMQVIAITHLPQVAAKGNAHFVVSKSVADGEAVSSIRQVDGEERVLEIARMLSGASVTPQAIANAESLLGGN